MITELTKEQLKLIPVVRQEWLDRVFKNRKEIDRDEVTELIYWLYDFAGAKNKKPQVNFVDSPLGCQYAANLIFNFKQVGSQVESQVWSQVESQVESQVWSQVGSQVESQVWSQVRSQVRSQVESQVESQVWSQVWSQVGSQVWSQVRSQVRSQVESQVESQVWSQVESQVGSQVGSQVESQVWSQVESQKLNFYYFTHYGDITDYGWMSFYDYFDRIGIDYKNENYNKFGQLITSGIFMMVVLDDCCIISAMPDDILCFDDKLHSDTQPAIHFKDGYELYFLYGICFEKELWQKITTRQIIAKEILKLENIEQRMAALKYYGTENMLAELNAKCIDKMQPDYELYKIDNVFSQTAYFLKYSCPSTGRIYVSGIDPAVGKLNDAAAALAWKFGLEKNDYNLIAES